MSSICWQNFAKKDAGSLLTSRLCFYSTSFFTNLLACELWVTGDFCRWKTRALHKAGIPDSWECAADSNLHEFLGSHSRSGYCHVCQCFLAYHLNLHSLFKEQLVLNGKVPQGSEKIYWPLATGLFYLLVWDLLAHLWENSSYMWTIFYIHQRENEERFH